MKITKSDFFNNLDKINLLDYKIDYKRNQNYFFYKGYKYVFETIITNNQILNNGMYKGIEENFYKFKL